MKSSTRELRATWRAKLDTDMLIEQRDADALFQRIELAREAAAEGKDFNAIRRVEFLRHLFGRYRNWDQQFGGIVFDRVGMFEKRPIVAVRQRPNNELSRDDYLTDYPYVAMHFVPQSLQHIRDDMHRAAEWLATDEVKECYPYVIGCTYSELARAAGRLGMQRAVTLGVANEYKDGLFSAHQTFLLLNGKPLDTPCVPETVYAETAQLAETWAQI